MSPITPLTDASSHAPLTLPGYHGAFVAEGFGQRPPVAVRTHDLDGVRVAAKDVFDIEGMRTGVGNPVWLAQQQPAGKTALAVRAVLEAGADWVGKTVTDELAYSVTGINAHYGTPQNPANPERIPGGSSSGSAVAVAAGDVDIALGTDCGGSMRLPASYCGIWGMRPTQGRVAPNGCFSLAHSFDTIGWFSRDGEVLSKVFCLTANSMPSNAPLPRFLVVRDAVALCDDAVRLAFDRLMAQLADRVQITELPLGRLPLADWAAAQRRLQAAEIWQQHGQWVSLHGDSLGVDVKRRFMMAAEISPADVAVMQGVRVSAGTDLAALLGGSSNVLVMPTVPAGAPRAHSSWEALETMRVRAQQLLSLAGLAGLPEVSLPWTTIEGCPVGLSVIGARWNDEGVLQAALALNQVMRPRDS